MRFYLRPGQAKLRLAPLVLAGGGRLCRVQEPGAVLLVQPGEAAPDGAVSTEYVTECVERNQRLPLESFLLTARGRLAFTEAEDAALLQAVRGQGTVRVSGRALWIELERRGLTRHSWQAMRDRYLRHLRPRLWGERGRRAGQGGVGPWRRRGRVGPGPAEPGRRCPRVSTEPPQTEDPARIKGLFAAASREFESTEVSEPAEQRRLGQAFPRATDGTIETHH